MNRGKKDYREQGFVSQNDAVHWFAGWLQIRNFRHSFILS